MVDFMTVQRQGAVARVVLNRPDVHNAFNETLINQLTEAIQNVGDDPTVRVVILASEGKSFCAGADLTWMQRMAKYTDAENKADAEALARLMKTLRTCPKPTLARVHGAAYGGGVGLVACCDMVFSVSSANFCFSEVKLGLLPAVISPYVLEKTGTSVASRYFLSAEVFSAAVAQQMGLVHEVVDSVEALDQRVDAHIETLLKNGPESMAKTKQLIIDVMQPAWLKQENLTVEAIARQRVSEEGQAGLKAFLNKEKAPWIVT